MLKGTCRFIKGAYISASKPLILMHKGGVEGYSVIKQDVADDNTGLMVVRMVGVGPSVLIAVPCLTGVGLIGVGVVTIGAAIALPIAGLVDVGALIKVRLARPDADIVPAVKEVNIQKSTYTSVKTCLSDAKHCTPTHSDDVGLSCSDATSYVKLLEDYMEPVTIDEKELRVSPAKHTH